MRVLVCGSRRWTDRERVWGVLDGFAALDAIEVIIEGAAPGADTMAREWARARNVALEEYPADWDRYRPKFEDRPNPAGVIRNRQMLVAGNPDYVVAFHLGGSPGTASMIRLARRAEIPVYVVSAGT